MKPREVQLVKDLLRLTKGKSYVSTGIDIIATDKQLHYYIYKWTEKGWWDYGVSARTGWFTPEGIEHFKEI